MLHVYVGSSKTGLYAVLHSMALSMFLYKVGFVHPIFNLALRDINTTLGLSTFPRHMMAWSGVRASSFRAFNRVHGYFHGIFAILLLAMPYWWALRRAKQLSTAATLLCWSSCSVVLMSCRVKSFYVVRSALLLCLSFVQISTNKNCWDDVPYFLD